MKKLNVYFVLMGIGIGAMISGLAFKLYPVPKVEYSDQEVMERARELGMVGIKEHIENNSTEQTSEVKAEDQAEKAPVAPAPKQVSISINMGDNSEAIAEKLLEVKAIDDKKNFVNFVSEKNAGRNFRQGTYLVELGSSYEEILSLLTKGVY